MNILSPVIKSSLLSIHLFFLLLHLKSFKKEIQFTTKIVLSNILREL